MMSNFGTHQNFLEVLLKPRLQGLTPRDSDSEGLGWSVSISNKFPLDAGAAGSQDHTLRTTDLEYLMP